MSMEFSAVLIVGVTSSEIVSTTDTASSIGGKEIGEIPTEYIMEAGLEFARDAVTEEDVYGRIIEITGDQYGPEAAYKRVDIAEVETAKVEVKEIFRALSVDAEPRLLLVLQAV
jgi:hypothetical protein